MAKFSKYNTKSAFTEVFTSRDHQTFQLAYGIGIDNTNQSVKIRQGDARQWILTICAVLAGKLDISVGAAKQLFESGRAEHLAKLHANMLPAMRKQLQEMITRGATNSTEFEKLEDRIKQCVKSTELDPSDLVAYVRGEWVWAMTVTHPSKEFHGVSGREKTKVGEKVAKVGEKVIAKPKATVTSKRPKAPQSSLAA